MLQDPFLFSATVRENIAFGAPRRRRRADRARRTTRTGRRLRPPAAGRLRNDHRRARDHALRRTAPADRDRARAPARAAHPHPRRRDRERRRDDRGQDPRRPARGDAGADDDHHRAPPLDDRPRGRARRARPRQDRRARDARPSCSGRASSTARSTSTGCSSASSRSEWRRARDDVGDRHDRGREAAALQGCCARRGRFAASPWLRTVLDMRVWQPGSHLTMQRGGEVRDWSWRATLRRIRFLARYTKRLPASHDARGRLAPARDADVARPAVPREGRDRRRRAKGRPRAPHRGSSSRSSPRASRASSRARRRRTSPAGRASGSSPTSATTSSATSSGCRSATTSGTARASMISRLTNDVDALDQLVTDGVTTLVQNSLTLIGSAIILFFLDWRLALATMTVIPSLVIATRILPHAPRAPTARCASGSGSSRRRSPRTSPACASSRRSRASRTTSSASRRSTRTTARRTSRRSC